MDSQNGTDSTGLEFVSRYIEAVEEELLSLNENDTENRPCYQSGPETEDNSKRDDYESGQFDCPHSSAASQDSTKFSEHQTLSKVEPDSVAVENERKSRSSQLSQRLGLLRHHLVSLQTADINHAALAPYISNDQESEEDATDIQCDLKHDAWSSNRYMELEQHYEQLCGNLTAMDCIIDGTNSDISLSINAGDMFQNENLLQKLHVYDDILHIAIATKYLTRKVACQLKVEQIDELVSHILEQSRLDAHAFDDQKLRQSFLPMVRYAEKRLVCFIDEIESQFRGLENVVDMMSISIARHRAFCREKQLTTVAKRHLQALWNVFKLSQDSIGANLSNARLLEAALNKRHDDLFLVGQASCVLRSLENCRNEIDAAIENYAVFNVAGLLQVPLRSLDVCLKSCQRRLSAQGVLLVSRKRELLDIVRRKDQQNLKSKSVVVRQLQERHDYVQGHFACLERIREALSTSSEILASSSEDDTYAQLIRVTEATKQEITALMLVVLSDSSGMESNAQSVSRLRGPEYIPKVTYCNLEDETLAITNHVHQQDLDAKLKNTDFETREAIALALNNIFSAPLLRDGK